jgi:hypothetical protein
LVAKASVSENDKTTDLLLEKMESICFAMWEKDPKD